MKLQSADGALGPLKGALIPPLHTAIETTMCALWARSKTKMDTAGVPAWFWANNRRAGKAEPLSPSPRGTRSLFRSHVHARDCVCVWKLVRHAEENLRVHNKWRHDRTRSPRALPVEVWHEPARVQLGSQGDSSDSLPRLAVADPATKHSNASKCCFSAEQLSVKNNKVSHFSWVVVFFFCLPFSTK